MNNVLSKFTSRRKGIVESSTSRNDENNHRRRRKLNIANIKAEQNIAQTQTQEETE